MKINSIAYCYNAKSFNSPQCNNIQRADNQNSHPNFGCSKQEFGCASIFVVGFVATLSGLFYTGHIQENDAKMKAEQNKEILNNTIKTNFQNSKEDKDNMNDAIVFAESYLPLHSEILGDSVKTNRNFQKLNSLIKSVTSPSSEDGNAISLNEKRIVDNICGKNRNK